MVFGFGLVNGV